jgi:hypothetical protein
VPLVVVVVAAAHHVCGAGGCQQQEVQPTNNALDATAGAASWCPAGTPLGVCRGLVLPADLVRLKVAGSVVHRKALFRIHFLPVVSHFSSVVRPTNTAAPRCMTREGLYIPSCAWTCTSCRAACVPLTRQNHISSATPVHAAMPGACRVRLPGSRLKAQAQQGSCDL